MNQEISELLERWPLAKEFNLPKDSRIVIAGAYKGLTMELLDTLYHPKAIVGYEPQNWAADIARERMLNSDTQSMVFTYGLGVRNEVLIMGEYHTDAASFVNIGPGSREQYQGNLKDAHYELLRLDWEVIDLMVMNIEGYEYFLLEHLKKHGWYKKINRLAVQFHLGFPGEELYHETLNKLNEAYKIQTNNLPTWGYWVNETANA